MNTPRTIAACAASIAVTAAILAPTSTSGTTETRRIAKLEQAVAALQVHADCIRGAIPVTNYTRPDGTRYLGATRRVGQKYQLVVVMTPHCVPRATNQDLGWHW